MSWDDGKHAKVKRVQLTFDAVIRSIEVEYDGTSLNSQQRGTVGTKSQGFTLSPDEYITEVNGYYRTVFSGEVITALEFKTNKATYGPYGNKTSNYFSHTAPRGNQIAGFLGSSNNVLNSIDVHFAPVPSPNTGGNTGGTTGTGTGTNTGSNSGGTTGPGSNIGGNTGGTTGTGSNTGGNSGGTTGTGSNTGGNTGGTIGPGSNIGGNTGGTTGTGSNTGGNTGGTTGTGSNTDGNTGGNTASNTDGNTGGNTGSNTGGTTGSDTGGNTGGTTGTGTNTGGSGANSGGTGSNTDSSPQKLEAQGGKGGNQWDDGADHDGVAKIEIVAGLGIQQIRFYYVKNGESKEGPARGVKGRGLTSTVSIKHPDEYLLSVEGWYDSSNIIQGIQFKTNQNTSEVFGYDFDGDGTQFSLHVKDKKIIGFHGFADSHLNSLGAYFVPISTSSSPMTPPPRTPPPNKVEARGGNYGETFDDGAFDHVRKVYVGQGDSGVAYVKFVYEKDGGKESREHGKITMLGTEEFEVDSDDYITSVEVYVDKLYNFKSEIVTALVFKTFKGKTSQQLGLAGGDKYELKDGQGGKLAGFHGKAGDVLYALGAYFTPTSTSSSTLTPPPKTPPPNKVKAHGGNYGETFDDGAFDHVRKVYVGQGDSGVAYVKFVYEKDGGKESREHGKMTLLGTEEFEVDSGDYITSVEVYVDKLYNFKSEIVTALVFKTFKGKTSQQLGLAGGDKYELKDGQGGKLAGFHGKASDVLYALGAYFTPTTN